MRYASYALIATGGGAMGFLQLSAAEPFPMLFSAATLTMGLLLLMMSKGPTIESPA